MALVKFTPDPSAIAALLSGPNSKVAAYLLGIGTEIATEARRRVGKDTRQLEQTIVPRLEAFNPKRPRVKVIAGTSYALAHHQGTRPHVIRPVRKKALRFVSGGAVVFATSVNHPGTRPNPYLVSALRHVAARRGLRIIR